ncbi:Putative membrane lipoprotein [Arabidopsis thaliana]|uniref:Defensin-like protein 269 n=2 Tax=Arabidopsis thaliana TaxID=3702 RepID=DF269_ARATH|nr:Putative membrane lipoprotein [Arabidopsis thaliana]Q2V4F4.1 RecName: Full=Defensin-like protein 269; Flags: Precursor [Arabidopsis thaliana]ABI34018.1 unknown [Arabidopsis thaliana]AEE34195.1 Putative membrane lipoprotein [Arabidopsis thaliana]|eukprot:NP_001031226.1 Putative membrane lipoprotein [Arabidopsis thaliana]
MAVSKTTMLIVLVAIILSCVSISNARQMQRPQNVECVGGECQPKHPQQYFGSCFRDSDCRNSCFPYCRYQKCHHHECICSLCSSEVAPSPK